eukprot:jgi/Orpsp1_1/1192223/evm.model.d7180000091483.1
MIMLVEIQILSIQIFVAHLLFLWLLLPQILHLEHIMIQRIMDLVYRLRMNPFILFQLIIPMYNHHHLLLQTTS